MNGFTKSELVALCRLAKAGRSRYEDKSQVKFHSRNGTLHAAADSNGMSLKIRTPSRKKIAAAALDATELQTALRHVSDSIVKLEFRQGSVDVAGTYRLKTRTFEALADEPAIDNALFWEVDTDTLKAFSKVAPFHGTERFKPNLLRWVIRLSDSGMLASAGNGRCYAALTCNEPNDVSTDIWLAPEILTVLPLMEGKLKLECRKLGSDVYHLVKSHRVEFGVTVPAELKFPNVEKLLYRPNPIRLRVARKALLHAAKIVVAAFTPAKAHMCMTAAIRMDFDPAESTLTLRPVDAALETKQKVAVAISEMPSSMVDFHWEGFAGYLPDILKFVSTDIVSLEFESAQAPMKIQGVDGGSHLVPSALIAHRKSK